LSAFPQSPPEITGVSAATKNNLSTTQKQVKVLPDGVEVTYTFPAPVISEDSEIKGTWHVSVPEFHAIQKHGVPETLFGRDSFTVPYGCSASVDIIESEYEDKSLALAPSRVELPMNCSERYEKLQPIVPYSGFFPCNTVEQSGTGIYRGVTIADVTVNPVQYDYESKTVRIFSKIKYKVSFNENAIRQNKAGKGRVRISPADTYLNSVTLNGLASLNSDEASESRRMAGFPSSAPVGISEGYLIITVPRYAAAANKLAEWKRQLGYDVMVESRSSWTATSVKACVENRYWNSPSDLTYLLILGDFNDVPGEICKTVYTAQRGQDYATDYLYCCMDGDDDMVADIFRGRIPVNTSAEAMTVIDKILGYERMPVIDASFYNNATHISCWESALSGGVNGATTHIKFYPACRVLEDAMDYLRGKQYAPAEIKRLYYAPQESDPKIWLDKNLKEEAVPSYLQKPTFKWDASGDKINDAINSGCQYVIYNGHGDTKYWEHINYGTDSGFFGTYNPYNSYPKKSVLDLANGNKLPLVFSMACHTGKYNNGNCLGEAFLKKSDGGAIAFVGLSEIGFNTNCQTMIEAFVRNIWPYSPFLGDNTTPNLRLGSLMDACVNNVFIQEDPSYYKKVCHLFGDPSMSYFRQIPKIFGDINVSVGEKNEWGLSEVSVTVEDNINNIRYAFRNKSTRESYCYLAGNTCCHLITGDWNDWELCVSAEGYIPCICENTSRKNLPEASEEEEIPNLINENLIWQYRTGTSDREGWTPPIQAIFNFRFKGTKEINGKEYHKLYTNRNVYSISSDLQRPINHDDLMKSIRELDPDNMEPSFYIRKDGDRYYMLMDQHAIDGYYELTSFYGSTQTESLIYDFSLQPGESYDVCTARNVDGTCPEDYHLECYFSRQGYVEVSETFHDGDMLPGLNPDISKQICHFRERDHDEMQIYKGYGVYWGGILPMPGFIPAGENGYYGEGDPILSNIYDLDGNIVVEGFNAIRPVEIDTVETEMPEAGYSDGKIFVRTAGGGTLNADLLDISGRTVRSFYGQDIIEERAEVTPGIYLLRVTSKSGSHTLKIRID